MPDFANKKLKAEELELVPVSIHHYRHASRDGLLTVAAHADVDIPPMTQAFLMEGAGISGADVPGNS